MSLVGYSWEWGLETVMTEVQYHLSLIESVARLGWCWC